MANSGETQPHRKRGAVLLTFFFLVSVTSMGVQAADSDGDGVQDSADDCPWSAGTSTVDKDGCPDRDGDGTSDFNDGWVIGLFLDDARGMPEEGDDQRHHGDESDDADDRQSPRRSESRQRRIVIPDLDP